jgi:tRNA synthetases class II core domain (F)
LQIDAKSGNRWVEIGECGLVLPTLLEENGLDPAHVSGLAMGLGLDRILMLRKGMEDIQLLRSSDPRVARQLLDLSPYRPVSSQPAIRRDLSVAVDGDKTAEELGDRVRAALGERRARRKRRGALGDALWRPPDHRGSQARDLPRAEERVVAGRVARPGARPHARRS